MLYPLLLMLILHTCAAMPPYFGSPFMRSSYGFPSPSAFNPWPSYSNFPRFENNWMSDFRAPTLGPSAFPSFSPIMPMMPQMPPMPAMPPMPPMPAMPTNNPQNAVCREVPDVKDLSFPPHSEIPTTNMKTEDILKNDVNKTTYICKDDDKKEFYMLRTHAVFATGNIRNKQDIISYYSMEKSPLTLGKDLKMDQNKIWGILDELEKEKGKKEETATSDQPLNHPFWSSLWSPFGFWNNNYPEPECTDHPFMAGLTYPVVDVSPASVGDEIVNKEVSHETKLCTDKTTHKKYYFLKTSVAVKTKNGHTVNRFSTMSHAADEEGNPLPRADGATSVVSSTISSITNGVPKTMSSYSTYHHV